MYRHDYSYLIKHLMVKQQGCMILDFYVINKDFNVYICIDNGSSG